MRPELDCYSKRVGQHTIGETKKRISKKKKQYKLYTQVLGEHLLHGKLIEPTKLYCICSGSPLLIGYGDNFMGGNFSQSIIFNNDGSVIEGGSNASMSGSNYFGQSLDNNTTSAGNIKWYAIGNQLHLIIYNNGSWQSVMLGTWYAENNHLLITGQDGKKVLLSR